MAYDPELEPAPDEIRSLFSGQALTHLDEIVLSWRTGGHPIDWYESAGLFEIYLESGIGTLFRVIAPVQGLPARIEMDVADAIRYGIPQNLAIRLWSELADIGNLTENEYAPISVSLGKFSRGDRKVFLAYALTIARELARPPKE
jgi:hypothetical protein